MASRPAELLAALSDYSEARQHLLQLLGCPASNRDPLAEFSEKLAHAILGGALATSRVQKGYDLITPAGEKVQVRSLANGADRWVNEHYVDFRGDCDRYALVVVENLVPVAVIIFDRDRIADVCAALGKRHPNQDQGLQFTRRNFQRIIGDPGTFAPLGVLTVRFPEDVSPDRVLEGAGCGRPHPER